MDYEKAYNKVLEKIREGLQPLPDGAKISGVTRAFLEEVFPELKESEDEKIRKALIRVLNENVGNGIEKYGAKLEDALVWLVKQGEQKPTDNVEPKFKVGDFIVNDYCMGKVMKLTNDTYLLDTGQGIPFSCEHNAHLWTIQDAKDGDVLYSLDSKQPFIFKHRKPNEQAAVYCGINTYGKFFIENTKDCVITTDKYIPADKSQRDILFKEMQKAGYEWDAEKKELKLLISNGSDFESNNSKQKSTWSEEDEKIITALIEGFRYHQLFNPTFGEVPNAEIISWIKSLKERLS